MSGSEDEDVLLERNKEIPEEDERREPDSRAIDIIHADNLSDFNDSVKVDEEAKGASRSKDEQRRKQIHHTKTNFTREYIAYKYSQRGKGELHEAIILAGKPVFLKYDLEDSQFKIVEKIREGNRVIRPPYPEEYPYEPYAFSIFEEIPAVAAQAKEATIDSLYEEAKEYVNEYNEQDDLKLTLNAVDIIFSYFQDRFATTHYDNIVGDNDSGKSSLGITVEATAYRPVYMTDPSAANIFRCLGTIEPGQCTIIIDEADKIDKSPEMMAILKTGYQLNGKVPKINSNTLKQEFFYTYALKWIISERSMGLNEAKGVYDRTFSYTTYPGDSQSDIKET